MTDERRARNRVAQIAREVLPSVILGDFVLSARQDAQLLSPDGVAIDAFRYAEAYVELEKKKWATRKTSTNSSTPFPRNEEIPK